MKDKSLTSTQKIYRVLNLRRRYFSLVATLLFGMSAVLTSCEKAGTYNVKLKVSAIVAGVTYRGDGVQKYICHHAYKAMNDLDQCTVLGEAIPLESQDHRYLFVIMRAANGRDASDMAAKILLANGQSPYAPRNFSLPRDWDLSPEDVPMIVRFPDMEDPRSIELVGKSPYPQFKALPIDSVKASAELTNGNVTKGRIVKIITWINDEQYRIGLVRLVNTEEALKYPFASWIHPDVFKTGD